MGTMKTGTETERGRAQLAEELAADTAGVTICFAPCNQADLNIAR